MRKYIGLFYFMSYVVFSTFGGQKNMMFIDYNYVAQESIAKKVITLINNGASWKTIESTFCSNRQTIQHYLKGHYDLPDVFPDENLMIPTQKRNKTLYNKLMNKVTANTAVNEACVPLTSKV